MHPQHSAALHGLDPVSYFENGPVPGDVTLRSEHDGAAYYFATEEHKAAFDADPEKYAPQYGGWCATALSEGKLFGADPTNYTVTDGRLFLFYRGQGGDTLPQWKENERERINSADAVWSNQSYAVHA